MIERLYEQNYVSLVKILFFVKDKIDEITANQQVEINQSQDIENKKNMMIDDLSYIMNQLASDLHQLTCFSFELRKQDQSDNKYSHALLDKLDINGLPFRETLLYEIIMSNSWNGTAEQG